MSILSDAEIAEIEGVVAVANTPRYLIKRLRALPSVQNLGDLPLSHLTKLYAANKATQPALCYSVIASLLSKPYDEMVATLAELDLSGLRFDAQSLRAAVTGLARPMTVQEFDLAPPRLVEHDAPRLITSATSGSSWTFDND